MQQRHNKHGLAIALTFSLAACGGGSSSGVESTPPPPPPPPPATKTCPDGSVIPVADTCPPAPTRSNVRTRFGIETDVTFPAVGDAVEFSWSEENGAYTLVTATGSDVLSLGDVDVDAERHYPATGYYGVSLSKDLNYQYTNIAILFENGWGSPFGAFAYGVPTAAGDVPVTGSASYSAMVAGGSYPEHGFWEYSIEGTALLNFDFGAGTLNGYFEPVIYGSGANAVSLGRYNFLNTIFGVGSTHFSGDLQHDSIAELGSFDGLFTGPQAAELMAQWTVPYLNPSTNQPGTLSGVWVGKKN